MTSLIEFTNETCNPRYSQAVLDYETGCYARCPWCYVYRVVNRWPDKFKVGFFPERIKKFSKHSTVFIGSMTDLFHKEVPSEQIGEILERSAKLPSDHTIIFMTKNPIRYLEFKDLYKDNFILGCTIETNMYPEDYNKYVYSPAKRFDDFRKVKHKYKLFSAEPITAFGNAYPYQILHLNVKWVVIGANSMPRFKEINGTWEKTKYWNPEPKKEEILQLMAVLREHKIKVLVKENAKRLGLAPYHYIIKLHQKTQLKMEKFL